MKKLFLCGVLAIASVAGFAQNVQFHYDFGHQMYKGADKNLESRGHMTTTVEMFRPDSWGSTYFFVDMDYLSSDKAKNAKYAGVQGAYWEISREFCFWQGTKMDWQSFHIEYNGGLNTQAGTYNDAWLTGLTYSGHSKDFSKTWSFSAMYKAIPQSAKIDGTRGWEHGFQLTGVWGINFAHGWCTFSGFVDFWKESRPWQGKVVETTDADGNVVKTTKGTKYILLSEPQFWVNLNKIKGMDKVNLSVGGEVELSNNFAGTGFFAIPTLAAKWTF